MLLLIKSKSTKWKIARIWDLHKTLFSLTDLCALHFLARFISHAGFFFFSPWRAQGDCSKWALAVHGPHAIYHSHVLMLIASLFQQQCTTQVLQAIWQMSCNNSGGVCALQQASHTVLYTFLMTEEHCMKVHSNAQDHTYTHLYVDTGYVLTNTYTHKYTERKNKTKPDKDSPYSQL